MTGRSMPRADVNIKMLSIMKMHEKKVNIFLGNALMLSDNVNNPPCYGSQTGQRDVSVLSSSTKMHFDHQTSFLSRGLVYSVSETPS